MTLGYRLATHASPSGNRPSFSQCNSIMQGLMDTEPDTVAELGGSNDAGYNTRHH